MQLARPGIALDPRRFGRGPQWRVSSVQMPSAIGEDLKLFGTTFLAGFLFISLLIA